MNSKFAAVRFGERMANGVGQINAVHFSGQFDIANDQIQTAT